MLSQQIAISYQFLLSEILDTLESLKKNTWVIHAPNTIPTIHSSIHQLVPFWETHHIPPCFKRLFVRLHQFLQLEREDGELPKLCHRLESHSQKLSMLFRAGEKFSAPFQALTKELALILFRALEYFEDNETVLFFVIRHAKRIDTHFGEQTTLELICKRYCMEQLSAFIHKRYHERGFDHLHPLIEKHIKAIAHA